MCYSPLYAWKFEREDPDSGEVIQHLKISKYESYFINREADYTLPCGKCAECLMQKSVEWSFRIMLESKYYKDNCFLTLTYADNPVSLNKRDYQLFLKRLRKKIGSFRYFLCGEYGSKGKRPHYHLIIFGWFPEDAEPVYSKKGKKTPYFSSKMLEEVWDLGFVSVGELTQYDAKYCAKYMQKLQDVKKELVQPFVSMSTHPGLGYQYFLDNKENLLKSDKIYFHGDYIKLPRYFLQKTEKDLPEGFDDYINLRDFRKLRSELVPNTLANFREREKKYKKLLT